LTTDQPRDFIQDALSRGTPRPEIESLLLQAGWPRPKVRATLAEFADVDFAIPVPRPRIAVDARDAFVYLVLFGTLYITAINLGSLGFQVIDRIYPNPVLAPAAAGYKLMALRWSIASVVVAGPVFVFVSMLVARFIRRDPAKRGSTVRRWLTYLTLTLASAVLIGDVIALVFGLLSEGLVAAFILKVVIVGGIAGGVFA
jgi:hypothetical protein